MTHRKVRIGEVIDDHCSRCRLLMNHGVVGIVEGEIKKVRCLTCYYEHPYRHGHAGRPQEKKKRDMNKLFHQVLRGKAPVAVPAEPTYKAPVTGRRVRIARPEEPNHHPHRHRIADPPAATQPPAPKGKGKVASWRKAWEERLKK